jgi:arylformamidase
MRYFDISVPVSDGLVTYAGDPPIHVELWHSMAQGAIADVRTLSMGVHTGTHIDAPAHFLPGGKTIDELDLETCFGPVQVMDLTAVAGGLIDRASLEAGLTPGVARVILKTRNSALWSLPAFDPGFVALLPDAAELLVERSIRLIGVDYLSVAPSPDPVSVHRILLSAGVVILEGLDLSSVPAGQYTLACLPLRLLGAEAAPARAILIADGVPQSPLFP